jgi:hypothetical protein
MTNTFTTGTHVVRRQGRPSNIGQTGRVVRVCDDVIGSAGDILIVVEAEDGSTWTAYDRQLEAL